MQDRITGGCDEKEASIELVHREEDAGLGCPDATERKINNLLYRAKLFLRSYQWIRRTKNSTLFMDLEGLFLCSQKDALEQFAETG